MKHRILTDTRRLYANTHAHAHPQHTRTSTTHTHVHNTHAHPQHTRTSTTHTHIHNTHAHPQHTRKRNTSAPRRSNITVRHAKTCPRTHAYFHTRILTHTHTQRTRKRDISLSRRSSKMFSRVFWLHSSGVPCFNVRHDCFCPVTIVCALERVALCCSVLQSVAVRCRVCAVSYITHHRPCPVNNV